MQGRVLRKVPGAVHETVEVLQRGAIRYLRFGADGGWQGAESMLPNQRPIFPYQRAFASVAECLPDVKTFVALGLGSGTALKSVRQSHPSSTLYGLEIDERVVDAAIRYFGAPDHKDANYWIGDGIAFLCNTDIQADLLFVDAYMANRVYGPCMAVDFPSVIRAATSDFGVAVCNVIASLPLQAKVRAFLDAGKQAFAEVALLAVGPPLPFAEQNILCVFSKQSGFLKLWQQSMRASRFANPVDRLVWPFRARTY